MNHHLLLSPSWSRDPLEAANSAAGPWLEGAEDMCQIGTLNLRVGRGRGTKKGQDDKFETLKRGIITAAAEWVFQDYSFADF